MISTASTALPTLTHYIIYIPYHKVTKSDNKANTTRATDIKEIKSHSPRGV